MLEGKTIVITGGGGVLCSAFAKELASRGAKIALLDLNLDACQIIADEINTAGGVAIAIQASVLDKASLENARKIVNDTFGKCDILLNGAGGNSPKGTTTNEYFNPSDLDNKDIYSFFDFEPDNVNAVFNLNFTGTLVPTQVFAKDMINKEAVILNISSMSAYAPLTKVPIYSAAKAAISNFTMWLSVYFADVGIRVNAMAPGFFLTKQNQKLLYDDNNNPTPRTGKILAKTPLNRLGKVEDLFGTLVYLLDNEMSSFVTGVVVPVDGGFMAYSGV